MTNAPFAPAQRSNRPGRGEGHKALRKPAIAGNLERPLGLQPSQGRLAIDRGAEGRRRSGEADARVGRSALGDRKAVARQMRAIDVLAKPESKAASRSPQRPTSSIVRKDRRSETPLIRWLGSWLGDRAAQRPIAEVIGSASYPHSVSS